MFYKAEIPIFLREHNNRMYRAINYYLSKFICELPRFVLFPLMFTTIVYWMSDLNNDPIRFMFCCLVLVLVANSAVSFGSFISAAAPSVNAALALSAPILVPLMIFSGYFLNNKSIPVYFTWFKYISWLGYANEALIINQWDGIESIKCDGNSTVCIFKTGDDVIKYLNMDKVYFKFYFSLKPKLTQTAIIKWLFFKIEPFQFEFDIAWCINTVI